MLVWYQFKAELAGLQSRFPRLQTLANDDSIARWNAGQIEMLAVHPASAGHGLNLQGQSRMVWMSLPWSLELYEQAVGRLHRGDGSDGTMEQAFVGVIGQNMVQLALGRPTMRKVRVPV